MDTLGDLEEYIERIHLEELFRRNYNEHRIEKAEKDRTKVLWKFASSTIQIFSCGILGVFWIHTP